MNDSPGAVDVPLEIGASRVVLRCPRPEDGAVVYASVLESLMDLRRFGASLPWSLEQPAVEISERYAQEARAKYLAREEFGFLVFTRTGETSGWACSSKERCVDIGSSKTDG